MTRKRLTDRTDRPAGEQSTVTVTVQTVQVFTSGGYGLDTLTIPGPHLTLADIRAANKAKSKREDNGCYFGAAEMRFFNSVPNPHVIFGRFFVDSKQFPGDVNHGIPAGRRMYKVCVIDDSGNVDHVVFPAPLIRLWPSVTELAKRPAADALPWHSEFTNYHDARIMLNAWVKHASTTRVVTPAGGAQCNQS